MKGTGLDELRDLVQAATPQQLGSSDQQ